MLIRPIKKNAPDKKISIRQFPSPEHPYIAFPSKNLTVLDISRFTFCKVDYVSKAFFTSINTPIEIFFASIDDVISSTRSTNACDVDI